MGSTARAGVLGMILLLKKQKNQKPHGGGRHEGKHVDAFVNPEYIGIYSLHSPSKRLAWVKKCRHVWLDQNFDPSLLTNKL